MPDADTSQWVQPSSVASLIVWLAGDAGKDETGAAIPVYDLCTCLPGGAPQQTTWVLRFAQEDNALWVTIC